MVTSKLDMEFVYMYSVDDTENFKSQILRWRDLKEVAQDWTEDWDASYETGVLSLKVGENLNISDSNSEYIIRIR
jgi:hypothetical protein